MERSPHLKDNVQVLHGAQSERPAVARLTGQLQNTEIVQSRSTKPPLLIVDDIRLTVRITKKSLGSDWQCDVASDGEQAVQMAGANFYSVILMDVMLPGMSGIDATKAIRSNERKRRRVTIFGLTASFDPEDLVDYAEAGMDGCIAKGSVLRRAVKTAVQTKRSAKPNQFIFVNERGIVEMSEIGVSSPKNSADSSPFGAVPSGSPNSVKFHEEKHPQSPPKSLPKKPEDTSFRIGDVDATNDETYRKIHGDNVDFRKQMLTKSLRKKRLTTPPGPLNRFPNLNFPKRRVNAFAADDGEEEARHYSKACLLVDDNALTVKVTTRAVNRSGMRCDVAVDGERAVQRAFDGTYQLILMDVMLPGFDGCEATMRIRGHERKNNTAKVPILGLTGATDTEDLKRYAESGMDGCIQKGATIQTAIKDAVSILKDNKTKFVFINGKNVHSLPCERLV